MIVVFFGYDIGRYWRWCGWF